MESEKNVWKFLKNVIWRISIFIPIFLDKLFEKKDENTTQMFLKKAVRRISKFLLNSLDRMSGGGRYSPQALKKLVKRKLVRKLAGKLVLSGKFERKVWFYVLNEKCVVDGAEKAAKIVVASRDEQKILEKLAVRSIYEEHGSIILD